MFFMGQSGLETVARSGKNACFLLDERHGLVLKPTTSCLCIEPPDSISLDHAFVRDGEGSKCRGWK